MEEVAQSCSSGWPRGLGFVVPVIQQHRLGVLCDPSSEGGEGGKTGRHGWWQERCWGVSTINEHCSRHQEVQTSL